MLLGLLRDTIQGHRAGGSGALQGYLAHTKQPLSIGQPQDPRHSRTVGSWGGAFSYERGTPVHRACLIAATCGYPMQLMEQPRGCRVQGYLAHKKQQPRRILQKPYAWGPMVILGRWAVFYERGTPCSCPHAAGTTAAEMPSGGGEVRWCVGVCGTRDSVTAHHPPPRTLL